MSNLSPSSFEDLEKVIRVQGIVIEFHDTHWGKTPLFIQKFP